MQFITVGVLAVATFLFQILKIFTPQIVKWVLISLGLGVVSYYGADAVTQYCIDQVHSRIGGIPASALVLLDYAGFTKAVNIFFGGVTAGLTLRFTTGAAGSIVKEFKFLA